VWKDMFVPQVPLVESALRVVLVYALMVVLVRLGGKRGLATMNTLDFVVVFLLAGVVENATIGEDTSVLGGAVSAVTLVAASRAVRRLLDTSPLAQRILEGRPTTVIEHGHVVQPRCESSVCEPASSTTPSGASTGTTSRRSSTGS
jgi:uncharacterized membrane protein YcaP (DUF421 family)